ncbi:hypothetical protein GCM10010452_21370 [Crossiella cryophila]
MTGLAGAGVRVLLIGTGNHPGPTLTSVPSVEPTIADLRTALVERCGVEAEQVRVLLDPPDARAMALAVTAAAQRAETVLLVWFIGHGLLGPGGELYLAAGGTDRLVPGLAEHQALSFGTLRQALGASRAASVVVVLDCCFSGRASLGAAGPAFTLAPAHGMYLIGSAEQLALAPPEARHTAFTGAFLDLLTHGDPRGPHQLTLDAAYDAVFRAMRDRQRPLPRRQAGDRSGSLVLAPNPAAPAPSPDPVRPPDPGRCPYPGLGAFGVEDAGLFHGRDRMIAGLLAAVAEPGRAGLVALVGPSGSGKTSLLNAGLLAALHRDGLPGLPGSASWPVLRFTPGTSPLDRLAARLDAAPEAADLHADPAAAADLADRLLAERPGARLLVLIDQFEELFTLCPDPAERTAFLHAVHVLAEPSRGVVVFALRADFYGQAAAHPELLAALRDRQLLIEPMTAAELRAAIEAPATAAGLALDDGLADVILHELGTADSALPLLSHVLWATWRQRSGSRLTVRGYRASGGIAQAIATTAEQVYTELDEPGREAARRLLPRLVRVSPDSVDTARPVEFAALVHGLPDPAAAQQAINRLTAARLLTLDRDTARLSHEVLLRAWPRLREWVDTDRDWLHAHQQLSTDATAWDRADRDPSLLYRGNRLAALRGRAAESRTDTADLEPVLAEFMTASWDDERRGVRRRRRVTAFLAVLVLLASTGLIGAIVFQRQATQAQDRDLARYLATEAEAQRERQPGLAKQLSLLAYRIDAEAGRGAVLSSLHTPGVLNHGEPATDVVPSADGRVLAIATSDAILLRGADAPMRVSNRRTGLIALNRNGSVLAAAGQAESQTIRLWDRAKPDQPRELTAPGPVTALALGTDREILYAGTNSGEIAVWDLGDPAAPKPLPSLRGHTGFVDSLAVSAQRGLLASASADGQVKLWDASGGQLFSFAGKKISESDRKSPQPWHRVAFDPTGRLLATPGDLRAAPHLWQLDDPRAPRPVDSSVGPRNSCLGGYGPRSVAFSPSDKHLVMLCDNKWHLLKYNSGAIASGASQELDVFLRPGPVVFDPQGGKQLLQATANGVYAWGLSNPDQPGALGALPLSYLAAGDLVFRSDGRRRLVLLQDAVSIGLWEVTDLAHPKIVGTIPVPRRNIAIEADLSPDGAVIAAAELVDDQRMVLRLRDTKAPGLPVLGTIEGIANELPEVEFHPAKPILAVSDHSTGPYPRRAPSAIRLYDIADPRRPRQLTSLPFETTDVGFSPDGTTLIADVRIDGARQLLGWDLTDPARPTELWRLPLPSDASVPTFGMRPDGKLLAVSANNDLRLWRVENRRPVGDPISVTAINSAGGSLAFSPDGTQLALYVRHRDSESAGYRPEVWNVANPSLPQRQFYLPGKKIVLIESLTFSPDGRVLAVTRSGDSVDFWSTDPEHILGTLCDSVGDPITQQQWDRYLPGRSYEPPCR